jgi:hypothetical protein
MIFLFKGVLESFGKKPDSSPTDLHRFFPMPPVAANRLQTFENSSISQFYRGKEGDRSNGKYYFGVA